MRIAIQGNYGSFHHIVARRQYGEDQAFIYSESFVEVFEALRSGTADAAVVAVENSLYGPIDEVKQLLNQYPTLRIVGEINEHIHQNLIGFSCVQLSSIQQVYSHPVALKQCEHYLASSLPAAAATTYHDTAAAVEFVKSTGDPTLAAIASSLAAEMYGLEILAANIEDTPDNYTRFLILES